MHKANKNRATSILAGIIRVHILTNKKLSTDTEQETIHCEKTNKQKNQVSILSNNCTNERNTSDFSSSSPEMDLLDYCGSQAEHE